MAQHNALFLLLIVVNTIWLSSNVLANDKLPIVIKQQLLTADYQHALPPLKELAKQGNSQAQYQLAQLFLNGLAVEKSAKQAEYWLKRAAKNNAKASYLLGSLYLQGKLLNKDKLQAIDYLILASEQGSRKAKNLLTSLKTVDQQNNSRLQRLFFSAIAQGNLSQAAQLMQKGITPNILNKQGETPLMVAIKHHQKKSALWLIEQARKAKKPMTQSLKLTAKDQWGNSALALAILNKQPEVASILIRYKANLNSLNYKKQTPLILAINSRQVALAQQLINEGASLTIKDNQGLNAVDYANKLGIALAIKKNKKPKSISTEQALKQKLLALAQQANDKNSPYFDWPLLAIAVAQKQQALIDALLKQGENPWYSRDENFDHNAISVALRHGDTQLVKRFLSLSYKQSVKPNASKHLLFLAIKYNNLTIIDALLAQIDMHELQQLSLEESPLGLAISLNNYDAFMHLSQAFLVNNRQNNHKQSYLLLASEKNFTPIAQQLIALGVDVNLQNSKGRNALWYAADHANRTLVMDLLQAQSQVEQADIQGYTPLMRAVIRNCYECAALLLRYGANAEKKTSNANTALMFAAQGKPKILAMMLKSDINVKARNKYSLTPLMLAINANCFECVSLLLKSGANPKRKNESGENAFDLAKDQPDILALLQRY